MGLANAAKRARFYTSTTNENQGGGNKKAGFPYQVGRSSWTSIFLGTTPFSARCCSLRGLKLTANPNVHQSRPTGTPANVSYWRNGANY